MSIPLFLVPNLAYRTEPLQRRIWGCWEKELELKVNLEIMTFFKFHFFALVLEILLEPQQ